MAEDRSVIVIVPAAQLTNANKLWNAIGHSGSENFGAQFSANGQSPASHYAVHSFEEEERAALKVAIGAGVLPGIVGVWGDYGLTEQEAQSAADAITVSVATGLPQGTGALQHLSGMLTGLGLQAVAPEL